MAAVSAQAARQVPKAIVPIVPSTSPAKPDPLGIESRQMRGVSDLTPAEIRDIPAVNPFEATKKVSSVVYVCDGSGSMMGLPFELLKAELHTSINTLAPHQSFNIIFFQEGGVLALSQSLLVANSNNKKFADYFLTQATVKSSSDPIASLTLAFASHPQLIYLLTDGAFDDDDAVVRSIERLNRDKRTRINTIAFLFPDAPNSDRKACEDVLSGIATGNGGIFNIVYTTAR